MCVPKAMLTTWRVFQALNALPLHQHRHAPNPTSKHCDVASGHHPPTDTHPLPNTDSSNTNNNSTNKMEGSSGSFLSRMLGRSPSKGAVAPSAQQPAAGQIPSASLAASGPIKGGGGVLGAAATPPQGSLKVAVQGAASSGNSNGWSIGSSSNVSSRCEADT